MVSWGDSGKAPEDTRLAIASGDLPSNTPPSPTIEETKPEISSVEFLGIIPPAALAVDIRMSISSDDFPSRTPPKVSVRAPESSAKRPDTASKPKRLVMSPVELPLSVDWTTSAREPTSSPMRFGDLRGDAFAEVVVEQASSVSAVGAYDATLDL